MATDYKHRASQPKRKPRPPVKETKKIVWWKWLTVVSLLALFIGFLIFLANSSPSTEPEGQPTLSTTQKISIPKVATTPPKPQQKPKPIHQNKPAEEPQFDFYTILPEAETVVPDHEIDTRSREEKFGKTQQNTLYIMQVGSFKQFTEADKLRARLALLGIESQVEKATVGSVVWNRVKIGPFTRSSTVSKIKQQLRENGIDAIVTELKK